MDNAYIQKLVQIRPSHRQLSWQENEMTAFLHYGMNTYTNREWGDGSESPQWFNPTALDTDQWCESLKAASVKALILTAKHHDGFCLWDTKKTNHSVMHSPFGKDVARLLSNSCAKYGLKLGFYLSPWDRNQSCYGEGEPYDDFFCAQLEELLTGYGPLYSLWFDGANGEGPSGRRQQYDWERYYALIRKHQPDACISVCGPDVRWCGNEAGQWRASEWSVVPAAMRDNEKIQSASQQADDTAFRARRIQSGDEDLGSRKALLDAGELCWYPCEVNVSIRPGWFFHPEENCSIKPLQELQNIYEHSAGGNGVLLLNVPPSPEGLIHEADAMRLAELGNWIRESFGQNLAELAKVHSSQPCGAHGAHNALGPDAAYWMPEAPIGAASLFLQFPKELEISRVVLREYIALSQRIEGFSVYGDMGGKQTLLYEGTTIGNRKICSFQKACLHGLEIRITDYRVCPTLSFIGAYA